MLPQTTVNLDFSINHCGKITIAGSQRMVYTEMLPQTFNHFSATPSQLQWFQFSYFSLQFSDLFSCIIFPNLLSWWTTARKPNKKVSNDYKYICMKKGGGNNTHNTYIYIYLASLWSLEDNSSQPTLRCPCQVILNNMFPIEWYTQ